MGGTKDFVCEGRMGRWMDGIERVLCAIVGEGGGRETMGFHNSLSLCNCVCEVYTVDDLPGTFPACEDISTASVYGSICKTTALRADLQRQSSPVS